MIRPLPWSAALLAVLAIGGCGKGGPAAAKADAHADETGGHAAPDEHAGEEHGPGEAIVLTAAAERNAGIVTENVRRGPLAAFVEVPGTVGIAPERSATVTAPVAGRIVRLFAGPGDRVARGQTLAEVRSPEIAEALVTVRAAERSVGEAEAAARSAASEYDLSRAKLRTAQAAVTRQRTLARSGLFAAGPLQEARNALNEASAERREAEAEDAAHEIVLARAERLYKDELIAKAELEAERLEHERDHIKVERLKERERIAREAFARETRTSRLGLRNEREIAEAQAQARAAALERDRAGIARKSAEAGVRSARQGLAAARASVATLRAGAGGSGDLVALTAPLSGTVTERRATLGQSVERTGDLFDIADLGEVVVTAAVPERDAAAAREGAVAEFRSPSSPGRSFRGRVTISGSAIDSKTRTLLARLRVRSDGLLLPGGSGSVRLPTVATETGLSIPESAIVGNGDERTVFVRTTEGYVAKKPRLGRALGDRREILDGLSSTDRVVVKGAFVLLTESRKEELGGHED